MKAAATDLSLHESSYQKADVAFKEKSILAPLARMESFPDNDDDELEEQVISPTVYTLCLRKNVTLFIFVTSLSDFTRFC